MHMRPGKASRVRAAETMTFGTSHICHQTARLFAKIGFAVRQRAHDLHTSLKGGGILRYDHSGVWRQRLAFHRSYKNRIGHRIGGRYLGIRPRQKRRPQA